MRDDAGTIALIQELRTICAKLPSAEEYVMVHHPAFRVRKRPFVVVGLKQTDEPLFAINHGHMAQAEMLEEERFSRTPYMGHNGWVTLCRKDTDAEELEGLVVASYRRIAGKRLLAKLDEG